MPQFNALIGVSLMMTMNLFALIHMGDLFQLFRLSRDDVKVIGVMVLVGVWLVNYTWLVRHGAFHQLPKRYADESIAQRRKNAALLWLYVIASFGILIAEAEIARRLHGAG